MLSSKNGGLKMASLEKIKKFLEVSGTKKSMVFLQNQFSEIVKGLVFGDIEDDIKEKFPKIYPKLVTTCRDSTERLHKVLMNKGLDFAMESFSGTFSDEELDEFIAFYSSPLYARFEKLMPVYTKKIMSVIQEERERLETQLKKFDDEFLNELEKRREGLQKIVTGYNIAR